MGCRPCTELAGKASLSPSAANAVMVKQNSANSRNQGASFFMGGSSCEMIGMFRKPTYAVGYKSPFAAIPLPAAKKQSLLIQQLRVGYAPAARAQAFPRCKLFQIFAGRLQ